MASRWPLKRTAAIAAGGLVLVAILAFAISSTLRAQSESSVGYVNVQRISNEYLTPLLDEPLTREIDRLQAEFDAAAAELNDEEKAILFRQYEEQLELYRQQLVDAEMPAIHAAIAAVAQEQGVTVVLTEAVVLHGGVDLTDGVLERLHGARD